MINANKSKIYDYIQTNKGVSCFESKTDMCGIIPLVNATSLSDWHDEPLQQATYEINSILEKIAEANKDDSKCLSLLKTPKGLFLAWTKKAMTSLHNDQDELCRELRI
jgi:hypothetical protein